MSANNELPKLTHQASALVLSGGGARAAYQAGVLKALAELAPESNPHPFQIICGTSAGAVNALLLASHPGTFKEAVERLCTLWLQLTVDQIYRSGWFSLMGNMLAITRSLFNQGVGRQRPLALLDNTPLRDLVTEVIQFDNIQRNIDAGILRAVCVNALSYGAGESVSFFQGAETLSEWHRFRRYGVRTRLTVDHLMASAAIPTLFSTVKIGNDYFGDGAVRQLAPISPALHLGANRVFVVGVSNNRSPVHWGKQRSKPPRHSPSIAQIAGQLFNAAFIDSLEGDLEHLDRVNLLLDSVEGEKLGELAPLRPVESAVIEPSQSLDRLAGRKVRFLPPALRWLFRATGATTSGGGASAASYLLFEKPFISELVELGYQDAMWERDKLRAFLQPEADSVQEARRGLFGRRVKPVTEANDGNTQS
ncbi:patatin-like phospholipase family protein [Microbulbifer thermotolerans]|uniref:Patatin n=1 Tax=Microbulbifer thermotolerans TaxID=252514 RepID=A0A143HMG5_MICTH|nr:patatin-like phospholipase family protein [Microbulbifer thermotolerans]AMX02721.1 patatin [Microbulbifer thermotolerans]MCX2779574.1 patatin-like phospholipase family protein [Microbulbifer thermotolerans]MCX2782539.1 patatin-like phospholipase family protein [Microbulbifer thermotolerans]MCX2794552.1 patatin-like phospholipase family protein [Microbulbifer thermotolerans]MCX2801379.1 patatin-like phospholipase family protein [Microbulbifer thermotolerans]